MDKMFLTDEEIREVFKTFDRRSTGAMDTSHLNEALQLLCIDLTEEERNDPKYKLAGNPATITEDEFMSFVREKFDKIDFMGRASESLSQFDERASGTLNRETMLLILTQRGSEPFSEEEANVILDDLDVNKTGRFDIMETTKLMYSS